MITYSFAAKLKDNHPPRQDYGAPDDCMIPCKTIKSTEIE